MLVKLEDSNNNKTVPSPKEWLLDNFETHKEDVWPSQQQIDCFEKMCNNDVLQKLIVKSYRLAGLTTLMLYSIAYRTITAPSNQTILFVTFSLRHAAECCGKFKEIMENINESVIILESRQKTVKLRLLNWLEITVLFENDDRNLFMFGKKYDYVFVDNAAFIDTFTVKDAFDSTNEELVIGSIPHGKDDFFYGEYVKTLNSKECIYGESDIFNLVWYLDDRKVEGLQWRRKTYDKNGEWVDMSIDSTVISPNFALSMFQAGYYPWSKWYGEMCKIFGNNYECIMEEVEGSFVNLLADKDELKEENDNVCQMLSYECPTICPKDCQFYKNLIKNDEL